MPPKVSVVIPAYNAASFIDKTLGTVAAQSYRDLEVVVVDDGSADDTKAVVDRWLEREKIPGRCIRQANKGIAGARNAGWRAARAEYVSFLDHDDAWHPEKLAASMAELEAHPESHLVCHDENVYENGKLTRVHRNGPWREGMYERLLFEGNALSPSCVTVRKAKLEEVGGFRENKEFNTVEDYDIWMRLAKACRMRFIARVLGDYNYDERGACRRIIYHHTNLEHLLRDHFKSLYGDAPGWTARLRMRRRLAAAYRSALGQLYTYDEEPQAQREYLARMLRAFPFDPKNIARALLWALRRLRR
ncbi:MAG: glycosyltransferase family A protein [Elusimicrobiota bacterium]